MFGRLFRRLVRRPSGPPPAPAVIARDLGVPAPDRDRELVLYKFDACPYCQIAMGAAEQLGVALTLKDTRRDPAARQEHTSRTGRTQVPCLYIDGEPLFESSDIVDWLHAYANRGASPA
jgi:glutaredoxin